MLFSISVLSLLGVSCTVVPRRETRTIVPVYQRPVGNPNAQSIHYYMMGEAAIFQGSYAHAFQFLSQADVFDPENVTIKERILETLYILAEEDSLIYNRIIELGNKYIEYDLASPTIYRFTGVGYFGINEYEKGLSLLRKALETEPDAYNYYDYFLYQARYIEKVDFLYLEKALAIGWDKPELVNAIAQLYEYHNPLRSKEILQRSFKLNGDTESFTKLLNFYRRYRDWNSFVDLVDQELIEGRRIEDEFMMLFLEYLFFFEEYEKIVDYYLYFNHYSDPQIQQYFFVASYYAEDYKFALEMGKSILENPHYEEEKQERMILSMSELYIKLEDYESAARYLEQIDNIAMVSALITGFVSGEDKVVDFEKLIQGLLTQGVSEQKIKYLKINYNLSNDNIEQALKQVEELLQQTKVDQAILTNLATRFLDINLKETSRLLLSKINDPEFRTDSFLGTHYYYTEQDSLAEFHLMNELADNESPDANDFLALASVLDRNNKHDRALKVVSRAVGLYPDDASILNWYGYSLIVHTDLYDEAEVYLLRAIDLEPESYHIQDSVAWLYFKKGDYEKALTYMQNIIENEIFDNSIITYHIGMIYYKLDNIDAAKEYLYLTLILDNDKEAVAEAESLIKQIEEKNE